MKRESFNKIRVMFAVCPEDTTPIPAALMVAVSQPVAMVLMKLIEFLVRRPEDEEAGGWSTGAWDQAKKFFGKNPEKFHLCCQALILARLIRTEKKRGVIVDYDRVLAVLRDHDERYADLIRDGWVTIHEASLRIDQEHLLRFGEPMGTADMADRLACLTMLGLAEFHTTPPDGLIWVRLSEDVRELAEKAERRMHQAEKFADN